MHDVTMPRKKCWPALSCFGFVSDKLSRRSAVKYGVLSEYATFVVLVSSLVLLQAPKRPSKQQCMMCDVR